MECENCGCAVYKLGCVNCEELEYINEQASFDKLPDAYVIYSDEPEGY